MKNTHDTKRIVLEQIRKGEISMRPRWHFVLKSSLVFFGIATIGAIVVTLASLLFFFLNISGIIFAPSLGLPPHALFILSSPWLLIVLVIGFLITLEALVRKYAFGYRKPLLYTGLVIVGIISLGVYLVSLTPTHRLFLEVAGGVDITDDTFLSKMYQIHGEQFSEHMYFGTITEVTPLGYRMQSSDGKIHPMVTDHETVIPEGMTFEVGEKVVVLGEYKTPQVDSDSMYVYTMREIPDNESFPIRDATTQSEVVSFNWLYKVSNINPDYPKSLVSLLVLREDGSRTEKSIATVDGSCNELTDEQLGALDSTQLLCYYAGFGYQFRIVFTEKGYDIQQKEIEEASPDHNPPIGEFKTVMSIPN
jgi:uncharacterized membrane protein YcgQ (UPF0703/DUF1980 family)